MTRPLMLCLPRTTFEALHKSADGRGKTTTVKKADLLSLLMDHSTVLAKLAEMQIEVNER